MKKITDAFCKKLPAAIAAATLALTSLSASAGDTWDMPAAYSAKNHITQSYLQFAETVTANSGGELEVIVHPAGSLYKGSEIMRAVRTGQVPLGGRYLGAHAAEDSVFGLDTLPFLVTSPEGARTLYEKSKPALEKAFEKRGMKLLFAVPWPAQGLFHKREINRVEDLKGTKFRAYDKNTSQLARLMGAIPTKTEATEISQAFSTGVADSMIGSGAIGVFQKLWDYVDNFYLVNAWIPKSAAFVNKEAWDELSPATQAVVLKAAAEAEASTWSKLAAVTDHYNNTLQENGMQVRQPSPELMSAFIRMGQQISADWSEDASAESRAIVKAMAQ
ncbi:MAG: TRAP transporter substrate-binding protein [Porticoccaceae bacterium]|nr:TRAP transporter substrate-binding protein [Porticoccaceae bacterium]